VNWVVFSYSLPSAPRSSPRVAVWRRLRTLGAASPKDGVHVLPARDECVEAFQWLGQEVEQAKGSALVMRVERFEGLSDPQVIDLFQRARKQDYGELDTQAAQLERSIAGKKRGRAEDLTRARDTLEKLRRWYADIARIDFFDCPDGIRVSSRLARIAHMLSPGLTPEVKVPAAAIAAYRGKRWVTRPHPHVDRLACAWLIRRFIDPKAIIRYADAPEPGEVAFDMSHGDFGHRGNLCTFETMVKAFTLDDPGLRAMAEIVHEIDLRDRRYTRPETAGIDVVLKGWMGLPDAECEAHGTAIFEALYTVLSKGARRNLRVRSKVQGGARSEVDHPQER
jgi:hypothetical protein